AASPVRARATAPSERGCRGMPLRSAARGAPAKTASYIPAQSDVIYARPHPKICDAGRSVAAPWGTRVAVRCTHGPECARVKRLVEVALGVVTSIGGFLEAGSMATSAQAGAEFGYHLLWAVGLGTLCAIVLVEMSGRLAAVSHHT